MAPTQVPAKVQATPSPPFSSTTELLAYLYKDLSRMSEVAAPNIVLHAADRDLLPSRPKSPLRGIKAVQAHEDGLIAATNGTLVMDVESITANEAFGVVLGTLRATTGASRPTTLGGEGRKNGDGTQQQQKQQQQGRDLAMPFCGVWRFEGRKAVEHWENAQDAQVMVDWLKRLAEDR